MAAQPDKKTVIRDLLELGKSKGQLSTKEILDALGELDFDPEQIEKFYDTLESQGVEIMTCGTCLNYYGLTDKLAVGGVTNMYSIVEKLAGASRVIRP